MKSKKMDLLIKIFNDIDPEELLPGQTDGAPIDEYTIECEKLLDFLSSKDNVTFDTLSLEINRIWIEYFNKKCAKVDILSKKILEEITTN